MRDTMWIYAAIILTILSMSEAWSGEPGTNQTTSVNSSTASQPKVCVIKNVTYNLGSEVNLTCGDKTWNEMMFVIWEIQLKYEYCKIAFNNDGLSQNNCTGDMSVQNGSNSQSYLHIPKSSANNVGIYKCESVYRGGNENYVINLSMTVRPSTSVRLEQRDNKKWAVCRAERGKPAATISWSIGNSSSVETLNYSDGLFTVESHLELPELMDTQNLSCAINHSSWNEIIMLQPYLEQQHKKGYFPWIYIPTVAIIIAFLAGFLIFAQKKLVMLRRCRQSDNSPSKSPPTEDVEEVEPYASYVQRVNSIYNSSADFFSHKNPAHASHAHS